MSALRALVEHFVAPPQESPPVSPRVTPVVPPAVALLCAPRHARPAGGTLGLRLAQRHGVRAALVAVWTGREAAAAASPAAGGPTTREARRIARACAGRELVAHAAGRVVLVDLPSDEAAAAGAAQRAFGVAAALPTVLVVAGARDAPMAELLASRDLVLVAGDDALADLAVDALRRDGVTARRCALPAAPAAAAAMRGMPLGPAARRACDLALEGTA